MGDHYDFLFRLLAALEKHRRRQAEVVINRYAHLIEWAAVRNARRADSPQPTAENRARAFK